MTRLLLIYCHTEVSNPSPSIFFLSTIYTKVFNPCPSLNTTIASTPCHLLNKISHFKLPKALLS